MPFTISATTLTFPDGTTMTTAAQSIPSGTVTNFFQAAAPTEWTKLTTNDNAAIRIVSGTGGTTGGSVNFTTAFASQSSGGSVNPFTLTTAEIPSHGHNFAWYVGPGTNVGTHMAGNGIYLQSSANITSTSSVGSTGSSGSHTHTFTGGTINLAVKYLDNIMCSKN